MISAADLHAGFAAMPGAVLDHPFGDDVQVYKLAGKMFGWFVEGGAEGLRVSLKCDPVLAEILRAEHPAIRPGYHTDKRHWNTLHLAAGIEDELVWSLLAASYELVRAKLPRKVQATIGSG